MQLCWLALLLLCFLLQSMFSNFVQNLTLPCLAGPCSYPLVSQRSLHDAPIFRLLLKVAVNGTHQCDFLNFCGAFGLQCWSCAGLRSPMKWLIAFASCNLVCVSVCVGALVNLQGKACKSNFNNHCSPLVSQMTDMQGTHLTFALFRSCTPLDRPCQHASFFIPSRPFGYDQV